MVVGGRGLKGDERRHEKLSERVVRELRNGRERMEGIWEAGVFV